MKHRILAVLAITVGCSLMAVLAIRQRLSDRHRQTQERPSQRAPDAVRDIQPLADLDDNVRIVDVQLAPEVPATGNAREVTYRRVPAGMRLISIDVMYDPSERLRPHDRVDLLLTTEQVTEENELRTRTRTLVRFLEVFALENETGAGGDVPPGPRVVHLLATREEVDRIRQGEREGVFYLVGRRPTDEST